MNSEDVLKYMRKLMLTVLVILANFGCFLPAPNVIRYAHDNINF